MATEKRSFFVITCITHISANFPLLLRANDKGSLLLSITATTDKKRANQPRLRKKQQNAQFHNNRSVTLGYAAARFFLYLARHACLISDKRGAGDHDKGANSEMDQNSF